MIRYLRISILVFILSILLWILYVKSDYEITYPFLLNLIRGGLTFISFQVFLILLLRKNIRRENKVNPQNKNNGLTSFLLLFACIIWFIPTFCSIIWSSGSEDVFIYENTQNKKEVIISQYHNDWDLNTSCRIVKVKNRNSLINRVVIIKDSTIWSKLSLNLNDSFPNEFVFENSTYKIAK